MYLKFASLNAAYAYLQSSHYPRRLWSILSFNTSPHFFVFCCTAAPGGQMFNIARGIFTLSGHYGAGKEHGRELAHDLRNTLLKSAMLRESPLAVPGAHAEEWLIHELPKIWPQVGAPREAIILNSHTPCTNLETDPSHTFTNLPRSCTSKLRWLAGKYTNIEWSVFYMRKFGRQEGRSTKDIAAYFHATRRDYAGAKIAIYPYTEAMQAEVRRYMPL